MNIENQPIYYNCTLESLCKVEVDLLKKLITVCEKYNLKYYVAGGTLLGVVRHKGFIPWDDDIDVDMTRDDYEKLCEVADKEFAEPYFLQTQNSDVGYFSGHAKLRNSDTTFLVKGDERCLYNKGIFIDIFPLDNVPDGRFAREVFLNRVSFFKDFVDFGSARCVDSKFGVRGKTLRKISLAARKIFGERRLCRKYEMFCMKYRRRKTECMSAIAFLPKKRDRIWNKKLFEQMLDTEFEGLKLKIPAGYQTILESMYGADYMTPKQNAPLHCATYISLTNETWRKDWR